MYKDGDSLTVISKSLNICRYSIKKILIENNIEIYNISDSIKRYYKKNMDKHPWRNNSKFISKPCENFKKILIENNIRFVEEFSEFKKHLYSIDVALPEFKLGFEINGNQHYYKDGTLKEYYQKRENYLSSEGWKIYQIHYTLCYNKEVIIKIINDGINNNKLEFDFDYDKYLYNILNRNGKRKKKNKCICGELISDKSKFCIKCYNLSRRKVDRPTQDTLISEVEENGYRATGKKYGVSDNAIKKWINYYKNL